MNTKQIVENMVKKFDNITYEDQLDETRTFSMPLDLEDEEAKAIKSFIHSYTKSLLSAFAEEVIGLDEHWVTPHDNTCYYNELRADQRLKAKEIIKSLEK